MKFIEILHFIKMKFQRVNMVKLNSKLALCFELYFSIAILSFGFVLWIHETHLIAVLPKIEGTNKSQLQARMKQIYTSILQDSSNELATEALYSNDVIVSKYVGTDGEKLLDGLNETTTDFVSTSKIKQSPELSGFYISGAYTGRLGNLMFEYASTLGIAKSNNLTMLISVQNELHKYFNLSVMRTERGVPEKADNIGENGCCRFARNLMNIQPKRNVTVHTYLQSFKYFQMIQEVIRREFRFHTSIREAADMFITNFTKMEKNVTLVGIHVRRGDILLKDKIDFGYTVPSTSYFINAMDYFRIQFSNVKFIVCSDDRKWWEKNMNLTNVVISKGTKPEVDMAILSKCDHVIISTGTFGWWAAFLANGITIYYNNWPSFNTSLAREVDHKDYFIPDWIPMDDNGFRPASVTLLTTSNN
ncbi:unnamed protein product [Owenia fusiformis]|uniref:L-Fucosyltransferase n=1 Tax=Owenia fusiformis TaxID=6347 RepID=A0A8J1XSM7_OWEFU|nr:unnamed protein product [Owenia fusiformis]